MYDFSNIYGQLSYYLEFFLARLDICFDTFSKETFINFSAFEGMRIEENCETDTYKADLTIPIADPSMDTILLRYRLIISTRFLF